MNQLSDLLGRLCRHQVEFVLVGGYAAVVHGVSFVTRDIDVCLKFSFENLERLQSALDGLHPAHRLTPQRLAFRVPAGDWQDLRNLYLETDWGVLDCLGDVLGVGSYDIVRSRSETIQLHFGPLQVMNADDLIRAKEAMGRPHDKLTAAQLRAIQERKRKQS